MGESSLDARLIGLEPTGTEGRLRFRLQPHLCRPDGELDSGPPSPRPQRRGSSSPDGLDNSLRVGHVVDSEPVLLDLHGSIAPRRALDPRALL